MNAWAQWSISANLSRLYYDLQHRAGLKRPSHNENIERFVGACRDARSPAKPPMKRGVGQARSGVRGARCAEARKMLMRISLRPAWSMELVA